MKQYIETQVLALLFCMSASAYSQDTIGVMANPQVKAKFPGGDAALQCYFDTTLRSDVVSNSTLKGYVFVRYQINLSGKVIDFNIMKHVSPEVDSEIVRAYRKMPLWTPATNEGKTVYHYQSYSFKLPYQRKSCGLPPIKK